MPLSPRTVDVPFEGGLDTNLDPKKVIPGKLLELENAVFTGSSIELRPGASVLSDAVHGGGTPLKEARALSSVGGELLRWTSAGVYAQVGSTAWAKRAGVAEADPLGFDVEAVAQQARSTENFDCVSTGGITVYTWTEAQEAVGNASARRVLYATVIDNATRTRYLSSYVVGIDVNGLESWRIQCRAFVCNGVVVLVYCVPVSGSTTVSSVYARTILPSAPGTVNAAGAALAQPPLRLGASFPYEMDALDMTEAGASTGRFVLAYNGVAGGVTLTWFTVNAGGTVAPLASIPTVTQATQSGLNNNLLSVHLKRLADPSRLFLMLANTQTNYPELHTYRTSDMVRLAVGNLSASTMGHFRATALEMTPGVLTVWADSYGTSPIRVCTINGAGVILTSLVTWFYGARLAGDAFNLRGRWFVPVLYHDTTGNTQVERPGIQPTFFLLDAVTAHVTLRALDGEAGGPFATTPHLPHVLVTTMGVGGTPDAVAVLAPRRARSEFQALNSFVGDVTIASLAQINITTLDPASVARIEEGGALHMGGACPMLYDGVSWVEDGFHVRPEGVQVTLKVGTPGMLSAGTYSWVFCYEWDDAKGRRHRSAPSTPATLTVAVNTTVQLEVPTLELTRKRGVRLALYRTLANQTTYHRQSTSRDTYIQTDPGTSLSRTVFILDGTSDVSVQDNELLSYGGASGGTSGGETWHAPPPAYTTGHRHGDYIFTDAMNNPAAVYYSLPAEDFAGPAWSADFRLSVPTSNGEVRALSTLDDKLIIHTAGGAYAVSGQGPTRDGNGNGLSAPTFVTGSVGCVSSASILPTADGVMFQSQSGIFLLTRGLETVKAGAGVNAYAKKTITRALQVADRRELRFYTAEGTTLVYSEEWGQWSVWTGQPTRDAVHHAGALRYTDGARVRVEDPTVSTEAGVPYSMVVGSAWLKWAGIVGLERVWKANLLGLCEVTTRLKVSVFFNYDDGAPVTEVEKVFQGSSVGGPRVLLMRHRLGRQLATALRFRWVFTPEPGSPSDKGRIGLTSMALEFGVHRAEGKRNMRFLGG